jgi:predicted TPR repeat methyltransferase
MPSEQTGVGLELHGAQGHYMLGAKYAARGDASHAAACFEHALALDPAHAAACVCLGDALMDLHAYDRALATYRRALTIRQPFPEAHHNLAAALLHLGDAAGAVDQCQRALAQRPGHALTLNTLGAALARLGRVEEALAALEQAVYLRPDYANAHHNLGNALDQAGRPAQARQAYQAALRINPALEEARYDLAALGAGPPPPWTPRPYLMRLFDTYATSFDQHLVEELHYQVPQMLQGAVMQILGPAPTSLEVIDLGCGTGLVGQLFRPVAGRLTGVDLSPGMIEQARRRQVYDQLVLRDMVEHLRVRQEGCDLVLAADVFIYMGDLAALFAEVARLLRPGGLFAFSLETTTEADYCLQHNRRYAQSLTYVQRLAAEHQLTTIQTTDVQLRRQGSDGAAGLIVVLGRACQTHRSGSAV